MSDLIDTTEMYLRTIYELLEEGVPPLRARIAERLHQSGPTVSQTVGRMERDGLLAVDQDRTIKLTRKGANLARDVMRKHRLAECLLTEVIGLEWDKVHDEACRWEHVISTDVEKRLIDILHSPTFSPYGNPIPGLKELGLDIEHTPFREGAEPLSQVLEEDEPQTVRLERMSEHIQAQLDLISALSDIGVRPGQVLTARLVGTILELVTEEGTSRIPREAADLLFVGPAQA